MPLPRNCSTCNEPFAWSPIFKGGEPTGQYYVYCSNKDCADYDLGIFTYEDPPCDVLPCVPGDEED